MLGIKLGNFRYKDEKVHQLFSVRQVSCFHELQQRSESAYDEQAKKWIVSHRLERIINNKSFKKTKKVIFMLFLNFSSQQVK